MRYPVIREGMIGSSRKSDVRLRSSSVRRTHAFFQLTPEGLRLRSSGRAHLAVEGASRREALLSDGSRLEIGRVQLMLVLSDPTGASLNAPPEFERPAPGLRRNPRKRRRTTCSGCRKTTPPPPLPETIRPMIGWILPWKALAPGLRSQNARNITILLIFNFTPRERRSPWRKLPTYPS